MVIRIRLLQAVFKSSSESIRQGIPPKIFMDKNVEFGSVEPVSGADNCLSGNSIAETSDAVHLVALNEEVKPSVRSDKEKPVLSNRPGDIYLPELTMRGFFYEGKPSR